MPRISAFFGIAVYMYWFDVKKHRKPHFHAIYQGQEAVFDLKGEMLEGNLGKQANKLVKIWVTENHSDIESAWEKAVKGEKLPWVTPLR